MLTDFRLRVFQTVAKRHSFTGAARELNISQPAVSQNIAELEQQIGDTLVERLPSGVKLTPRGEILLKYAEKILRLYDTMNMELVPTGHQDLNPVRIAACPIAARFILPKAIEKYLEIFPKGDVILLEREDSMIKEALVDGTADLGVTIGAPENMASTPLAKVSMTETHDTFMEIVFCYPQESTLTQSSRRFINIAKTSL